MIYFIINNLKVFTAVVQARMVGNGVEILHSEITREEYDRWQYNYPRSEAEMNEPARRKMKGDNNG